MYLTYTAILFVFCGMSVVRADPVPLSNKTGVPSQILKKESLDGSRPRVVDPFLTSNYIHSTMTGAQSLMNPCTLSDFVRENLKRTTQKGKSKTGMFQRLVSREVLLRSAMPSLREGINLYRTLFVLQETSNLTVFLDQNKDDIYSNTVLQNYSHYYIRAGNSDATQILFIGLITDADLVARGTESPALEFLTVSGLVHHPRQYIEFDMIPEDEAMLIMEKRQQMAAFLSTQDTFWADDMDYIGDLLTVAFNGPEQNAEYNEMLPKIMKVFNHKMATWDPLLDDKYDTICEKWTGDKISPLDPRSHNLKM